MKIALGPLHYYWPREATLAFYDRIADAPVDIVYVGESVCSRRHELRLSDWIALGESLAAAGKEVVLSSQTLIESESDLRTLRRVVDQPHFRVEANDMAAVRLLAGKCGWVAGPTLNVFNHETLQILIERGASRFVAPPEMSRSMLAQMRGRSTPVETEVFGYGRLALAYSARCFTARRYNLQKDSCEFRCIEFADGLTLRTREGEAFLSINGIQTQSAKVHNLLADLPTLVEDGIDIVRISPQPHQTPAVAECFRAVIDGNKRPADALAECREWMPEDACNGFWHGRAGADEYVTNGNRDP